MNKYIKLEVKNSGRCFLNETRWRDGIKNSRKFFVNVSCIRGDTNTDRTSRPFANYRAQGQYTIKPVRHHYSTIELFVTWRNAKFKNCVCVVQYVCSDTEPGVMYTCLNIKKPWKYNNWERIINCRFCDIVRSDPSQNFITFQETLLQIHTRIEKWLRNWFRKFLHYHNDEYNWKTTRSYRFTFWYLSFLSLSLLICINLFWERLTFPWKSIRNKDIYSFVLGNHRALGVP